MITVRSGMIISLEVMVVMVVVVVVCACVSVSVCVWGGRDSYDVHADPRVPMHNVNYGAGPKHILDWDDCNVMFW